jgi:fluoride ion exporter CrcB/FEX
MGRLDRQELAAIIAGGASAAVLRVRLGQHFPQTTAHWPWTIFIINITGSFALRYFATFTTRMRETYRLAVDADERSAVINAIGRRLPGFGVGQVGRTVGLHL